MTTTEPSTHTLAWQLFEGARDGRPALHELADGRRLHVTIGYDEYCDPLVQDEFHGEVRWRDDRHPARPSNMDGGARVLWVGRESYWWQPPPDALNDKMLLDSLRSTITDILTFGYVFITVSVQEKCDHDCWHAVERQSVGEIEPCDNLVCVDVIENLLDELGVLA